MGRGEEVPEERWRWREGVIIAASTIIEEGQLESRRKSKSSRLLVGFDHRNETSDVLPAVMV